MSHKFELSISPDMLASAISEQLEIYQSDLIKEIDKITAKSAKELVRITKDTAPYDASHHGKHFVDCIACKKTTSRIGATSYTWYVKSPCYRLTHLLVKGHAKVNGERTPKDPFLSNACNKVFADYEKAIMEILRNAGK